MAFQFLNADLEITSDLPLDRIRDALLGSNRHFSEMYCGEIGAEGYMASFEVHPEHMADWAASSTGESSSAEQKVEAFCAAISKFSDDLKQIWDHATRRVIDVGYQSDDYCVQLRDSFRASTLAKMADLNIDLALTVYPMTIKNADGGIVPMNDKVGCGDLEGRER